MDSVFSSELLPVFFSVAALTLIAGSPLKIDLRPVLPDAVPILASFLRKNQRALKLCTLAALDILLRNYR